MHAIRKLLSRLLSPRPMFVKPAPVVLGSGDKGRAVLAAILASTRPDAIRARSNNYRRSIRRILDMVKN